MSDWRTVLKEWLIEIFTAPLMLLIYVIVGTAVLIFVIAIVKIRLRDKVGLIRPGTRASDIVPRTPPAPPTMILDTSERRHPRVTKVILYRTERGHFVTNGPDSVGVTDSVASVTIGEDTLPIKVVRDDTVRQASDRPEDAQGDREGERRPADSRVRPAGVEGPRTRRRARRSRRRAEGADES